MTLKDIAEKVGVSVSTVSRVLNDQHSKAASDDVRRRIWEVVRESGYIPNSNAQELRKSKPGKSVSKRYYVLVCVRNSDLRSALFFQELAEAIEFEAHKKNCVLRCVFYANDLEHPNFRSILLEKQIDGMIVLGRSRQAWMNELAESQKNIVFVSLNPQKSKHDVIYCDGYKLSIEAMNYLIKLGHEDIAYIGECERELRYLGYCDTLSKNGIPLDRSRIVNVSQTIDGGYKGANTLIARNTGVSAIFCADDATAIGVLKALKEHKIDVPGDISLIGVNDSEMSRYVSPMLTTVHIPILDLSREAVYRLVERMEGKKGLPVRVELPFSIVSRESCAPYRPKKGGAKPDRK